MSFSYDVEVCSIIFLSLLRSRGDDREYYNDLPGKVPPDIGPPPVPPLPVLHNAASTTTISNLSRG